MLPRSLRQPLVNLRRRWRAVALGEAVALLTLTASGLMVAQTALDWWFEIPWAGRLGLLVADAAALGGIYWRWPHQRLRRKLNLANTALLVERQWPELRQCLITAVELGAGAKFASRGSPLLVERVFECARRRLAPLNLSTAAPARWLKRWVTLAALALALTAGLAAWTSPTSGVLVARMLLSTQPLPTKTVVEPLTRDLTLAVGGTVELKARAKGVMPARGRLVVWHEQGGTREFSLAPDADGVVAHALANVQQGFKYAFYLGDGKSPQFTVAVRVPPVVSALELEQVWPAYTKLPPRKRVPSDLALLAGSRLRARVASSSKLGAATVVLQGLAENAELKLDGGKTAAAGEIAIPAKDLTGLAIRLVDEAGVKSVNETVYPVALLPDHPPQVTVLEPREERLTVTLRARPALSFTANDDFGLARLSVACQLLPPQVAGQEAEAPPVQYLPMKINAADGGTNYRHQFDLTKLSPALKEGWSVNYWIEAVDNNDVTGPGLTRTEVKQLAIVSPEEKQAEIFERLRQSADAIDNLSNTQQKISHEVGEAIQRK
jgi:hypothetical protein